MVSLPYVYRDEGQQWYHEGALALFDVPSVQQDCLQVLPRRRSRLHQRHPVLRRWLSNMSRHSLRNLRESVNDASIQCASFSIPIVSVAI